MPTAQTKEDIWQTYLDTARYVRYYPTLATRWRRWNWATRIILGVAATGAVTALLGGLPTEVGLAAGAAIAVLAVLELVVDVGRRAVLLDTIVADIGQIETECQRLWETARMDRLSEDEAQREYAHLTQRIDRVTSRLVLAIDAKLNQRCTEDAYRVSVDRYTAA